jgi:ABC-type transport system substrate-binding protein
MFEPAPARKSIATGICVRVLASRLRSAAVGGCWNFLANSAFRFVALLLCALALMGGVSCSHSAPRNEVVMIIESSPTNLDPRVGTDAQSERIDKPLFDALLRRDEHFNLQPALAERWEIPDPRTYIFHLRRGVRFHDGRPLTSVDVKWTFDSILSGVIRTAKASTCRDVESIETPDDATVIFHLREPYSSLLWNLSDAAIGIVPRGSGEDFNRAPIGSGPFRLVSMEQDQQVTIARNQQYWAGAPKLPAVRFIVVPDATTRALELRKGSADVAINSLTADAVFALRADPALVTMTAPGTIYAYLAMNLRDPILRDVRVRQALAYAIDREPIIHYLLRDLARPAASVLPPQHWAFDGDVAQYPHDPRRARELLDQAGYKVGKDGYRFHLNMKTSTEESTHLLTAVLQQQLREVDIALDIRSFEFATFYGDITRGAFQLFSLRWIGGNEDPDIFEHIFASTSTPPRRANRGYYSNPEVDRLIDDARASVDRLRLKADYDGIQQIVARELPYINLWYFDNVLVHSRRLRNVHLSSSGNYDFLKTAELAP